MFCKQCNETGYLTRVVPGQREIEEYPCSCNPQSCPNCKDIIKKLNDDIEDRDSTIKYLRAKAEFDMPVSMHGCYHNACTDSCDMIDGPCACGASHNVKEWIEKLDKYVKKFRAEIFRYNKELSDALSKNEQLQAELDKENNSIDKFKEALNEAYSTIAAFIAALKKSLEVNNG